MIICVPKICKGDQFDYMRKCVNITCGLIHRNLIGKHKNSILGFGWNFVTPALLLLVYYVVFTEIRESSMENFWLYLATGIFPLNFMISNLTVGSTTIISNSNSIKKMYFPRELFVISQVMSSFVILMIGEVLVIVISMMCGHFYGISLLGIFPTMLFLLVFVTGYVFILSSLTVYVRDIQYVVSSFSILFYFVTPIYFTIGGLEGTLLNFVYANPFTYFIELFHNCMYYSSYSIDLYFMVSFIISVLSIVLGIIIFRKLNRGFVERL